MVRAIFGDRTASTARPRAGCRRSAGWHRGLELLVDATREPLRHSLSDLLHDAGATKLCHHAAHRQVGVHDDARPFLTRLQLRRHCRGGTASAARLRALGPDADRVRRLVHALDGDPALVGNADRPQLDFDLAAVGRVVDHLGERGARDTVRDLWHVEKIGPRRLDGSRQLEARGDDHLRTLAKKKTAGTWWYRPRAPVATSVRQDPMMAVPGSTRWNQVRPAGNFISLPSAPTIFSGSSGFDRSHVAL